MVEPVANTVLANGMSFDEILALGDAPENLYYALVWDGVDKMEFDLREGTESNFHVYDNQFETGTPGVQELAGQALQDQFSTWTQSIYDVINSDLAAQGEERQKIDNIDLAAQLDAIKGLNSSRVFDIITTDILKGLLQ